MSIALIALALQSSAPADIIYVTGDRQGEVVTSLAISRVDQAEISQTGAQHPAELVNQIPGVGMQRGNGTEHLTRALVIICSDAGLEQCFIRRFCFN